MAQPTSISGAPDKLTTLNNVSLFSALDSYTLAELGRSASQRSYSSGAIILGPGEAVPGLFVIKRGVVNKVAFGDNGREMTLARFDRGECFGLTELMQGGAGGAFVVAVGRVQGIWLAASVVRDVMLRHPKVTQAALTELARRVREREHLVEGLVLRDVPQRLARLLERLAERHGVPDHEGTLILERPTQQQLANMIGTCRETVSRVLAAMARQGRISMRGRAIVLRAMPQAEPCAA